MNGDQSPPDDTLLWCFERCIEDLNIPTLAISSLAQVVAPNGLEELPELVQCRFALRSIEELSRAGRVDDSTYSSLVLLAEQSESLRAPGTEPHRLNCGPEMLLEVQTAGIIQALRKEPYMTDERLLYHLETLFPEPNSPEAQQRAAELVGLVQGHGYNNPFEGRAELMRRYQLEPLLAPLLQFVEQAKAALGPTLLRVINGDINAGRYIPGEGAVPQPLAAAPAGLAGKGALHPPPPPAASQPAGSSYRLGGAYWSEPAQQAEQEQLLAKAWPAAYGRTRKPMAQKQERQPSFAAPVPPPSAAGGISPDLPSPASQSPSLGRGGSPEAQPAALAEEEQPRKRAREGGRKEDTAPEAARKLQETTEQLRQTGGEDPLPQALQDADAALGRAQVCVPPPDALESEEEEVEEEQEREEEEEGEEGRRQPQRGRQVAWSSPDIDELPEAPRMQPHPARRMPSPLLPLPRMGLLDEEQEQGRRRKFRRWSEEETNALFELVVKYGVGNWASMMADPLAKSHIHASRNTVDYKDKWRNLRNSGLHEEAESKRRAYMRDIKATRQRLRELSEERRQQALEQEGDGTDDGDVIGGEGEGQREDEIEEDEGHEAASSPQRQQQEQEAERDEEEGGMAVAAGGGEGAKRLGWPGLGRARRKAARRAPLRLRKAGEAAFRNDEGREQQGDVEEAAVARDSEAEEGGEEEEEREERNDVPARSGGGRVTRSGSKRAAATAAKGGGGSFQKGGKKAVGWHKTRSQQQREVEAAVARECEDLLEDQEEQLGTVDGEDGGGEESSEEQDEPVGDTVSTSSEEEASENGDDGGVEEEGADEEEAAAAS